jgi:predicted alpha/beta hydrolase
VLDWDLREQMLLAKWKDEGHEFRSMGSSAVGAVLCLRCQTLVHVRTRALAAAGQAPWKSGKPQTVAPCVPKK